MPRKKRDDAPPPINETILNTPLEEVLHNSMMPYAEHVILERALPRVEDGLKPVQRRILYTMLELSLEPDKPHRKSARVVGDCLGKYHPHGDTSVYDAIVRMAQPFNMREKLVDGHGNFGSIDGDSAAAMRYTETRMTPLAMELLRGIEQNTVEFTLNFDDSMREPVVLPGRFPNLLVNGASGIAVGLATNMPPHNLREATEAVIAYIKNEDITAQKLMDILPAPDFPTGGLLIQNDEIAQAYTTGRGKLTLRAKVDIEAGNAGRTLLVITELPYQVGRSKLLKDILAFSEEPRGAQLKVYDIRDESDRTGMRAVVELKRDADPQRALTLLYKYTDMQTTFGANMVAIVEGKPRQLSLKEIIAYYTSHQREVVTRRAKHELDAAERRSHVLEGLTRAADVLDEIIALIRASKTPKDAREGMMRAFMFSEEQAQAILDLRLQRLTGLEILAIRKEMDELQKVINRLRGILGDDRKRDKLIIEELKAIALKHGNDRRTALIADDSARTALVLEEKPPAEEVCVLLTHGGFFKRMTPKAYQKRDDDLPLAELPYRIISTDTEARLLAFTDRGAFYALPVSALPECRWKDRGAMPSGIFPDMEDGEDIVELMPLEGSDNLHLMALTEGGMVKRTPLSDYILRTKGRSQAIKLRNGDGVAAVMTVDAAAEYDMALFTGKGMAIAFPVSDVPVQGRVSLGVKGVAPALMDRARFMLPLGDGEIVLCSDRGYMKRVFTFDLERQARGGKGQKVMPFIKTGTTGTHLVAAMAVTDPYELIIERKSGANERVSTEEIRIAGLADKGTAYAVVTDEDPVERVVRGG